MAKSNTTGTENSLLIQEAANQTSTQKRLKEHFRRWERTPYKLGSISKRGIDCSGFVQLTYREVFAKTVPRTTRKLLKYGKSVSKKYLKFGDLVFFKTGHKQQHVGIYVGNGRFIHASTSQGVTQSNLNSSYWKKHFWTAKRLLS
jgi:cell wall-associated NlpC family hydrolase